MIRLSPKHGLNPAIPKCFFCMQDKNEVVIPGLLRGDVEAPRNAVWNMQPCDECAGLMKAGIILVSVRDGESGNNPYRTGKFAVVTEDFIRRVILEPLTTQLLTLRFGFIEDRYWTALDLPTGNIDNR